MATSTGEFGPIYRGYKHKPRAAIKHLLKVRKGECVAALYREDIGDINIIWGAVTDSKKHTGYGLAHIIDKHGAEIKGFGYKIEDFIPLIIQYGAFNKKRSQKGQKVFDGKYFRFVIAIQQGNGGKKQWLLTAFTIKKPKE